MKSHKRTITGLDVSRETVERLEHFAQLFVKWNKVTNLAAPSTVEDLWNRHIIDSARVFQLSPGPRKWIDLGSGGGFPGVVTAILLAETGDGWVNLVESNNKKSAFLRVALQETGARGAVYPTRIESAVTQVRDIDLMSARALADLDKLCEFMFLWAKDRPEMRAFFHKGRDYEAELVKARGRWQFDLVKHNSVVEKDSVILEIADLRRAI